MIADKEALSAARVLRDYCTERQCSECIFNAEDNLRCSKDTIPDEWEPPEIRLPEAAKEHLMQRFTKTM